MNYGTGISSRTDTGVMCAMHGSNFNFIEFNFESWHTFDTFWDFLLQAKHFVQFWHTSATFLHFDWLSHFAKKLFLWCGGPLPLHCCINNPELMDVVGDVEEPAAVILWLAILWVKYNGLIPEVREQLEAEMRVVSQGNKKMDLDMYLSIIDMETRKAEEVLKAYNTWSMDSAVVVLREKADNTKQLKEVLSLAKELS